MKPSLEAISGTFDGGIVYQSAAGKSFDFLWHFHPQIELTYIVAGRGERFVGDHIGQFGPGDLVLIGRQLPHTYASSTDLPCRRGVCRAVVVQFNENFVGDLTTPSTPELRTLARLLLRARRGLFFSPQTRARVGRELLNMERQSRLGRLGWLIKCLDDLAADTAAGPLSSEGYRPDLSVFGRHRIADVCAFLQKNFARPIRVADAAAIACLSASAFSRLFHRSTGRTFNDYINELRIARACERLVESEEKIATIAMEVGFDNLAHFNRQFSRRRKRTPRQYRNSLIRRQV